MSGPIDPAPPSTKTPDSGPPPTGLQRLRSALARACLGAASHLSLRTLDALGRCIAPFAIQVRGRARNSLLLNLRLCFPELDERERLELGRASLAEGLTAMLELGPIWFWGRERVLSLVREVRGAEDLERAVSSGRGAVLIGPHLGSWEVSGLYVSAHYPVTSMYRTPRAPGLERVYRHARERFGARLVAADAGGVRQLYRTLQRSEVVGVLPDQDPGAGAGIFVPFFGLSANTSTLTARLLAATDAVPLLTWAERLPRGQGFCLHFIELKDEAMRCGDVVRATQALNLAIERLIRQKPEQYLWTYQRFRHQPDGRRNPYRHGIEQVAPLTVGTEPRRTAADSS